MDISDLKYTPCNIDASIMLENIGIKSGFWKCKYTKDIIFKKKSIRRIWLQKQRNEINRLKNEVKVNKRNMDHQ